MGHDAEGGGLRLSTAFRRTRGGGVSAAFHQVEIELVRSLVGQLLELVRGQPAAREPQVSDDPLAAALGFGDDATRPTDPVVLRLFPDGYRDDDEAATEFRRFTERSLREAKADSAATMLASLDAVSSAKSTEDISKREKIRLRLNPAQAQAWLRTLTDLRLALGTRLGVEEGDDEHWEALADDDPRRHIHDVYEWLGWVQETLVRALSVRLP